MSFVKALFGRYQVIGSPDQADCVMGHSFGTDVSPYGINRQLVNYIHKHASGLPVIADRNIVLADPEGERNYAHIIDGQITKMDGRSGTGMALLNAQAYMAKNNLKHPLMVAHKYHIDRVVRQAAKLGMISITLPGLPDQFDKKSKQVWTRSKLLFIPANILAYIKLKIDGVI